MHLCSGLESGPRICEEILHCIQLLLKYESIFHCCFKELLLNKSYNKNKEQLLAVPASLNLVVFRGRSDLYAPTSHNL